jgi:hypothetical protein
MNYVIPFLMILFNFDSVVKVKVGFEVNNTDGINYDQHFKTTY